MFHKKIDRDKLMKTARLRIETFHSGILISQPSLH